jgi:hypothetical protein
MLATNNNLFQNVVVEKHYEYSMYELVITH